MTRHTAGLAFALTLPLLVAGCDRGEEDASASCEDARTDLAIDEVSPLGFSAQQVLDAVEKTFNETLVWHDDTTTGLTLTVDYTDGAIHYVDSEVADDGNGDGAYPLCEDRVEISATVQFKTDDGAFDETWSVTLTSPTSERAYFNLDIDPDSLTGSYDFRAIDPADYDTVKAYLYADLTADGSSGRLTEQGEKVEGDVASATATDAATWPAAAE